MKPNSIRLILPLMILVPLFAIGGLGLYAYQAAFAELRTVTRSVSKQVVDLSRSRVATFLDNNLVVLQGAAVASRSGDLRVGSDCNGATDFASREECYLELRDFLFNQVNSHPFIGAMLFSTIYSDYAKVEVDISGEYSFLSDRLDTDFMRTEFGRRGQQGGWVETVNPSYRCFFPTERAWYRSAIASSDRFGLPVPTLGNVYAFSSSGYGVTPSVRLEDPQGNTLGVLAIDIPLDQLQAELDSIAQNVQAIASGAPFTPSAEVLEELEEEFAEEVAEDAEEARGGPVVANEPPPRPPECVVSSGGSDDEVGVEIPPLALPAILLFENRGEDGFEEVFGRVGTDSELMACFEESMVEEDRTRCTTENPLDTREQVEASWAFLKPLREEFHGEEDREDWYVMVVVPKSLFTRDLERHAARTGMVALGAVALAGFVGVSLSALWIAVPISRLGDAARALEANEFDPDSLDNLKPYPDELNQLATLFQRMGAEINSRMTDFNEQIKQLESLNKEYSSQGNMSTIGKYRLLLQKSREILGRKQK